MILLYRFFLQICYQFSLSIKLFFQFIILFRGLNFCHLILKIAEWAPIVEFVFNLFLIEINLIILIFHQLPNLICWYCCFLTVWIVRVFLNYFYCWNYMLLIFLPLTILFFYLPLSILSSFYLQYLSPSIQIPFSFLDSTNIFLIFQLFD